MEVLKSIIGSIDTSSTSAVGFYNEILGLESSVLGNMNQINRTIQTLSFIQSVQNAMLKNAILKIQDKYTLMTGVIVDLTNKRREYLSKMMEVVTNKQKILQQIAMHTISQARNPLSGLVKDLSGNRDLLALLRAYYQQSANFMKFQDAREVVNHRLNSMYAMVNSLQAQFVRAVQDYMDYDTVVRIDNLTNANKVSFKRMSDLEGSLMSTEETILTAETDLSVKLGFPGVMLDMVGGSGYVDRLVQAFTEIAGGQDGGAIDPTRVALLPSVVPRLNDVDMVSFGGILTDRLAQCQRAYSIMAERNENQGDYNTVELALLTGKEAQGTLNAVMNKLGIYTESITKVIEFRNAALSQYQNGIVSGVNYTTNPNLFSSPFVSEASFKNQLEKLWTIVTVKGTDLQTAANASTTPAAIVAKYTLWKDALNIKANPSVADVQKGISTIENAINNLKVDANGNIIDKDIYRSLVKNLRDRILHNARMSGNKVEVDYAVSDDAKTKCKEIDAAVDDYVKTYKEPTFTAISLVGGKRRRTAAKKSPKKSSGKKRGGAKKKRSAKKSSPKRRGGATLGGKKKRSTKKRSSGRKH
jgi:hypothetical protein